jgi:mono/diheme cytochrome c family protein
VESSERPHSSRDRGSIVTILAVAVLAIGAAVGIGFVIAANADEGGQKVSVPGGGKVTLTKAEAKGREVFGDNCANCHTLAAADAVGKIGPNLDDVRPNAALVRSLIRTGIESPLGSMPPGLVTGTDANDVAAFVAVATGASPGS